MMNQYADQLGLKNSHFMNPEGLQDPNHYSTAYDIALLSKEIIDHHPQYYKIYSEKDFVYNGIKQGNRNTLLYKDATVDGLKTGHTDDAGYCLAASAVRNGMRLISVVLGTDSFKAREEASAQLLDYGFRYYQTSKIYDAGQVLQTSRVWKGTQRDIKLGVKNQLYITIPKDQAANFDATITMASDVIAPIQVGQVIGKIDIAIKDKSYASVPLVALEAVEQANFFKRVWDSILLFFHQLMS
jgi:D-alanyl-D-alanine carboxypeptidase (penicillin-binding protein 5/6)